VAKIAISLPDDVLEDIERERTVTGESRSEFLRRAVRTLLHHLREQEAVERYVKGYQEQPDTEEERTVVASTSRRAMAENPWETDSGQ
jgi:metal-responsive CopG/Arc/MetJ family transcriptional regulator